MSLRSTSTIVRTDFTNVLGYSVSRYSPCADTNVGEYDMSRECKSCKKLEEIIAIGIHAPSWVCYDCGEPIKHKEEADDE